MNEQDRRLLAEQPIPWDDLRAQRVLASLQTRSVDTARRSRRPRHKAVMAVLAVAAVFIVGIFGVMAAGLLSPGTAAPHRLTALTASAVAGPQTQTQTQTQAQTQTQTQTQQVVASTLTLSDGSTARLGRAARVDITEQASETVRLTQTAGSVRYDVTPDPARSFEVEADGVVVRVLGTAFTVALEPTVVTVVVHHGRVEVTRGARVSVLGRGDRLAIERDASAGDPEPTPELIVIEDETAAAPPARAKPTAPTADVLQARADAARARGDLPAAASALSLLVRHHRADTRAYAAWFQLGKVERARGRHGKAAAAFAACAKRSPRGALSEDARAEAAASWNAAGKPSRASAAAEAYLERHPAGAHKARMLRILDR